MDMRYDDPYQNPPLHISLDRGLQRLYGNEAEQFVRFRAGYADQDIGRIRAQQTFMAALLGQMMKFDIPQMERIWEVASAHINTDITVSDMLWFAPRVTRVKLEDIITHTLPGEPARVGTGPNPASVWSVYRAESIKLINEYYNPFVEEIPDGNFNIIEISRRNDHYINIGGRTMAQLLGN
jgi:anionic cell wall polymer biosynthesis LytR-Cps2A-Psr (LCP) family protein